MHTPWFEQSRRDETDIYIYLIFFRAWSILTFNPRANKMIDEWTLNTSIHITKKVHTIQFRKNILILHS